jgi:hypothetical protein
MKSISKEAFEELKANTTLIASVDEASIGIDEADCATGACPVR